MQFYEDQALSRSKVLRCYGRLRDEPEDTEHDQRGGRPVVSLAVPSVKTNMAAEGSLTPEVW
jgi:hypothetical protein